LAKAFRFFISQSLSFANISKDKVLVWSVAVDIKLIHLGKREVNILANLFAPPKCPLSKGTTLSNARLIRDGSIIYTGKIASIFREKNQVKLVGAGQECGITLKDFNDYQKKDIIEAFSSTSTERMI
jgi:hypothetical protein